MSFSVFDHDEQHEIMELARRSVEQIISNRTEPETPNRKSTKDKGNLGGGTKKAKHGGTSTANDVSEFQDDDDLFDEDDEDDIDLAGLNELFGGRKRRRPKVSSSLVFFFFFVLNDF